MGGKLESIRWRIDALLWHTDMKATRFTLAAAAILTGVLILIGPGYWPGSYASAMTAGGLFLVQGVTMGWQLIAGGRHRTVSMYVDGVLGCLLWSYVCASNLTYEAWHYSDAAHIAIAAASWWSLVRWGDTADAD